MAYQYLLLSESELGGSISRCLQTAQSIEKLERHINKCEEREVFQNNLCAL